MQTGIIFVLFGAIICIETIPIIDTPCKRNDSACFTKVVNELYKYAIAGDTALDAEALDPVHIDLIQGSLAVLQYQLHNLTLVGFKDCDIVNSTHTKNQLGFVMRCLVLDMKGSYEVNGELLSIPVNGKGQFTTECKDYIVTVNGKIKTSKRKDGKEYLAFKNYKANGDLIGGVKFHLTNLFDGQKDLEETFYRVVNENWKELSKGLQLPIVDSNMKSIINNLNKIMKAVTLEAIYRDE